MNVSLTSITPNAETNIVEIARVSSSRVDKTEKPEGLINYLIRNKHWSPFEHAFITMEIETSMSIGEQFLRHRSFTFQKLSGRYTTIEAMEPIQLRKQATTNRQSSTEVFDPIIPGIDGKGYPASVVIEELISASQIIYNQLLDAEVARECSRLILPATAQTRFYMTGSIRSWIHLVDIRDDGHAQLEAQQIARKMKHILIDELPIITTALGYKK